MNLRIPLDSAVLFRHFYSRLHKNRRDFAPLASLAHVGYKVPRSKLRGIRPAEIEHGGIVGASDPS
jgi:hypothetical protein